MFSYTQIDRHAETRKDTKQVQRYLEDSASRVLVWHKGKLIVRKNNDLFFLFNDLHEIKNNLSEPIYLGRHKQQHYFTYVLKQWHERFDELDLLDLRSASRFVKNIDLGLLFYSQGLLNWHRNHQFCAKCGSGANVIHSGHARRCINVDCAREHFPRIEPAVIFSIINNSEAESRILLARQSSWDKDRYSVIAGFVEAGESLEDAVKREGYEEVGLAIDNINYVASQPWPFPSSFMIGFTCETSQLKFSLIDQELETASWYTAKELETDIRSGSLKLPFSVSISWHLIDRWFIQQTGYSLNAIKQNE